MKYVVARGVVVKFHVVRLLLARRIEGVAPITGTGGAGLVGDWLASRW